MSWLFNPWSLLLFTFALIIGNIALVKYTAHLGVKPTDTQATPEKTDVKKDQS